MLTTTYQKAFILVPYVLCEAGFGPQGPCPGTGATGSKSSTFSKCGISGLKFPRSSYLDRLIRKHS